MKCRNCDHETYLLVCERCREAVSSHSRVTHCGQCGAINSAAFTFCASCGAKRPTARKPIVLRAPQSRPAALSCRRCRQTITQGIEVCPFCASDCRPLEERMLTVFGQFSVAAAFLLLFAVPVYFYFLSGAGGQRDRMTSAISATSVSTPPVIPSSRADLQPPTTPVASANNST